MRRRSGNRADETGLVREAAASSPEKEDAAWRRKTAAQPLDGACRAVPVKGSFCAWVSVCFSAVVFLVVEPDEHS